MKGILILLLALVALMNSRHVHDGVIGGSPGFVGSPVPNNGGSWGGPNNFGGSGVRPGQPNQWNNGNNGAWNNNNGPHPLTPTGRTTSMNGVTCSGNNPLSLGTAFYAGPTRMSCKNFNGALIYTDICLNLHQCASLMCSKYIRCPGALSYTAA